MYCNEIHKNIFPLNNCLNFKIFINIFKTFIFLKLQLVFLNLYKFKNLKYLNVQNYSLIKSKGICNIDLNHILIGLNIYLPSLNSQSYSSNLFSTFMYNLNFQIILQNFQPFLLIYYVDIFF